MCDKVKLHCLIIDGVENEIVCACQKEKDAQLDSTFQSNEYCHPVIDPLYDPPFSGFDLLRPNSTALFSKCVKRPILCITLVKQQDQRSLHQHSFSQEKRIRFLINDSKDSVGYTQNAVFHFYHMTPNFFIFLLICNLCQHYYILEGFKSLIRATYKYKFQYGQTIIELTAIL